MSTHLLFPVEDLGMFDAAWAAMGLEEASHFRLQRRTRLDLNSGGVLAARLEDSPDALCILRGGRVLD